MEWYAKAAAQGHAQAQFNLGIRYECGRGVAQDAALAVEWFAKAAAQGHAQAQFNVGLCYELGRGVAQDNALAVQWHTKAAAQGIEPAVGAVARLTANASQRTS